MHGSAQGAALASAHAMPWARRLPKAAAWPAYQPATAALAFPGPARLERRQSASLGSGECEPTCRPHLEAAALAGRLQLLEQHAPHLLRSRGEGRAGRRGCRTDAGAARADGSGMQAAARGAQWAPRQGPGLLHPVLHSTRALGCPGTGARSSPPPAQNPWPTPAARKGWRLEGWGGAQTQGHALPCQSPAHPAHAAPPTLRRCRLGTTTATRQLSKREPCTHT